ncbi:MAG: DUF2946 family protein [Pseudomonadota bacterium]|nr:DUF2946 family protein [Pseudomonadota bacterium]
MDESVRLAMKKWPNVPAAYHWLSLDRRGRWLLEGRLLRHERTIAFIARNYLCDEHGAWYFQNGPQKVFVALAYTPWVYHLAGGRNAGSPGSLLSHTGIEVQRIVSSWMDQEGSLLLETELGIGVLDDRDLDALTSCMLDEDGQPLTDRELADRIERLMSQDAETVIVLGYGEQRVAVRPIRAGEVPQRFGFIQNPQPAADDSAPTPA